MKEISHKSQGSPGLSPDEEADPSAQPNIALLFKLREREIERKKLRARIVAVLCAIGVLAAAGGVYLWLRDKQPPDDPLAESSPPSVRTITAGGVREQVAGDYILRTIGINGLSNQEFPVGLYDFDANRFMRGQEVVDDPNELQRLLTERAADLKNSLIVVFAGASFEGVPDKNRRLCRRRGCYVGKLALTVSGAAPDRLWMIAAGEHKSPALAGPDEEKQEEDVRSSPGGEQTLRAQRKLLLITIPSDGAGGSPPEVVKAVVETLRRWNFLPTDYDHGQSEPTPLAEMKCEQFAP